MPPVSEPHVQHDLLLVASLAAGDLAGAERDHAAAQIASCADCASLHADLIAIARATAALPPAVAPRDFTLSPEQAAALRPTGWRRLVAAIKGSRPLMSRQLGMGLATIGLAGLLVSILPTVQLGSAGAAPAASAPENRQVVVGAAEGSGSDITGEGGSPGSVAAPIPDKSSPSTTYDNSLNGVGVYGTGGPAASAAAAAAQNGSGANPTDQSVSGPTSSEQRTFSESSVESDGGRGLLLAGSLVILWAGIALLVIRTLVRRSVRR